MILKHETNLSCALQIAKMGIFVSSYKYSDYGLNCLFEDTDTTQKNIIKYQSARKGAFLVLEWLGEEVRDDVHLHPNKVVSQKMDGINWRKIVVAPIDSSLLRVIDIEYSDEEMTNHLDYLASQRPIIYAFKPRFMKVKEIEDEIEKIRLERPCIDIIRGDKEEDEMEGVIVYSL